MPNFFRRLDVYLRSTTRHGNKITRQEKTGSKGQDAGEGRETGE
jgi:hypothetical protein